MPLQGTVKRLIQDKGFGFIRETGATTEYFFHRSSLGNHTEFEMLKEGDLVSFEVEKNPKGPRAGNVVLME